MRTRTQNPASNATTHVGMKLEKWLHERVKSIAAKNGVSLNFCIQRSLIRLVLENTIPWPTSEEEARLKGVEIPTYDAPTKKVAQTSPVTP